MQHKGVHYIHSGIDVARAVKRIETDNIGSIQMAGGQNKLFLFLAVDSSNLKKALVDVTSPSTTDEDAHLATILEKVNEGGVGKQIKLLDNIAGRVGSSTCGAGKPLHWSNRNRM